MTMSSAHPALQGSPLAPDGQHVPLSPEAGHTAFEGMAAMLDATSAESAAEGTMRFAGALMEVVGQKRTCPARDVTSAFHRPRR